MTSRYRDRPSLWQVIAIAVVLGTFLGALYLWPLATLHGSLFGPAIAGFVSYVLALSLSAYLLGPLRKGRLAIVALGCGAIAGLVHWFVTPIPQHGLSLAVIAGAALGLLWPALETHFKFE